MTAILSVSYGLICVGYVVGFLVDDEDFSNVGKILMAILSPIIAPLLFSAGLGMIISAKIKQGKNR